MSNDMAVLVVSCDKYQDLWKPFFTLFFRYWQNCPYPVYLGSNRLTYTDSRVKMITVGDDKDWSSGFRKMLEQIPHHYVIVLLEDYLLYKPVDTDKIRELVSYMKRRGAGVLRLFPCPGPDMPSQDNPEVGEICKGADYRVSMQAAIWDRQILCSLLHDGESAWNFEMVGSIRSDELEVPFLSVNKDSVKQPPIPYFCTAVVKGKWLRDAVNLCRKEGIEIDLSVRPCETHFDRLKGFVMHDVIGKFLSLLSKRGLRDIEISHP